MAADGHQQDRALRRRSDVSAPHHFYAEVLGLEVAMEDRVLGLTSPTNPQAQVIIPPGMEDPQPRFGIDVGDPAAVDAAHAAVVEGAYASSIR